MEYQEVDDNVMDGEKAKLDKAAEEYGNDVPILRLLAGKTMVRILPPHKDAQVAGFFREIHRHEIYEKGQRAQIFGCALSMHGTACPACEMGEEMLKSGNPELVKIAGDKLRPRKKYLYNVLCQSSPPPSRGDPTVYGTVYVMEAGVKTHNQIVNLDRDNMSGWQKLATPENGVNLIIHRTGTDKNNTVYTVIPNGAGRTNLFEDLKARGIDHTTITPYNLETLYACLPDDEVKAIIATIKLPAVEEEAPSPSPALPAVSPTPAPVAPADAPIAAPVPATAPLPAPGVAPPAPTAPAPHLVPQPTTGEPPVQPAAPATNDGTLPPPVNTTADSQEAPVPPAIPAPPTE